MDVVIKHHKNNNIVNSPEYINIPSPLNDSISGDPSIMSPMILDDNDSINEFKNTINNNFQLYLISNNLSYTIHDRASKYYMESANFINFLKLSNNFENICINYASYLSVIFDIGIDYNKSFQEVIFKNINNRFSNKINNMLNFIANNNVDHTNISNDKIPFYIYNLDKINDYKIINYIKSNNYNIKSINKYLDNYNFLKKYNDFFKVKDYENLYKIRMNFINNIINFCEKNKSQIVDYIDNYID
jgi:hypothetical protein